MGEGNIVEIIPGVAWVVKNLLSEEECDECIAAGDEFGLQAPNEKITLRTAKRTSYYMNAELSERVAAALPMEMVQTLESITPHTPVSGLHPNWRIVRYDSGESFPAHHDAADHTERRDAEGKQRRLESSHTLLIMLSDRTTVTGGATRFWPTGAFDHAVDVELPKGHAVIFRQRKCLHNGQCVQSGVKYIAQAGIMRELPREGRVPASPIFRWYHGGADGSKLL